MRRVRTLRERTFSRAPGCCAFTLLRGQKGQVFLALSEANTGRLDLYCWDGGDWIQLRPPGCVPPEWAGRNPLALPAQGLAENGR